MLPTDEQGKPPTQQANKPRRPSIGRDPRLLPREYSLLAEAVYTGQTSIEVPCGVGAEGQRKASRMKVYLYKVLAGMRQGWGFDIADPKERPIAERFAEIGREVGVAVLPPSTKVTQGSTIKPSAQWRLRAYHKSTREDAEAIAGAIAGALADGPLTRPDAHSFATGSETYVERSPEIAALLTSIKDGLSSIAGETEAGQRLPRSEREAVDTREVVGRGLPIDGKPHPGETVLERLRGGGAMPPREGGTPET